MPSDILIVVAALDEADRIVETIGALAVAFPGAPVWVADDGSTDATPELARTAGATVVRGPSGARGTRRAPRDGVVGKGQAMTAGVRAALSSLPSESVAETILVLCDGDLGESAARLSRLAEAVRLGEADVAVAKFARRVGGGVGLAVGFARWAIRRRCGLRTRAPISGQRALRANVVRDVLPFAPGYGMEIGMTIDAVRAGHRVLEIELPLSHRSTGRTLAGFVHRGRQLVDFVRVYRARRRSCT
jgi:glycosyltransferase involved in cell wall biosynthesis